MEFKFLKQTVDCIFDVTDAMTTLHSAAGKRMMRRGLDNIEGNFRTCTKAIGIRKGNIKLVVEQYER
ncbi:hypothetical protein [Serratia marcescens]|uniref:hypothetical protein n=1 Tax=Serratia marcescens TaxID=615 RepID=UPI0011150BC1|nr:hypothetical protein [Serratia marcescens]MDY7608101.1 hypothetical protein [Serratia marcescens]